MPERKTGIAAMVETILEIERASVVPFSERMEIRKKYIEGMRRAKAAWEALSPEERLKQTEERRRAKALKEEQHLNDVRNWARSVGLPVLGDPHP